MEKREEITLLIVEDEQALRNGLASLPWGQQGITLLSPAKNGQEAIERADENPVDILLTDIRMPGPSGIEVAEHVRSCYPGAEILFLSGYGEFEYAQRAITLQACGYILKPSNPRDILSAVGQARDRIASRKNQKDSYQQLQQEVSQLSRVVDTSRMVEQQRSREIPCEDDIIQIVRYISEHYREPLTLVCLAEAFHFNSVYLSRYIKKKSGHTFTELLTSTRMYHAARLLKETSLKNGEICDRIGMGDERYFGQVFQKTYGVSPQEYRKSKRQMERDLMDLLMGDKP